MMCKLLPEDFFNAADPPIPGERIVAGLGINPKRCEITVGEHGALEIRQKGSSNGDLIIAPYLWWCEGPEEDISTWHDRQLQAEFKRRKNITPRDTQYGPFNADNETVRDAIADELRRRNISLPS